MQKLSAVIITLNEERNIGRCVRAALKVVDEVIVVDSDSKDKTVEIARELGCKVHNKEWMGYSAQKNFANELATSEYILSLDADEELSPELISSIAEIKKRGFEGAYLLNRLTNYCGHWIKYSGWYPDAKVRIFPREGSRWDGEFVHEELILPKGSEVHSLKGDLFHYSYYSFEEHRKRADKYSELTAKKMHAKGKKAGPLKPLLSGFARFVGMYFLKAGFLDGYMGFKIAWISAQSNVYKYNYLRSLNQNG